jgi:hypothetical protein
MPPAPPVNGPEPLPPPALSEPTPVPPPYVPYQDRNGPLLRDDPWLERPGSPPPGWFGSLEANIVGPHVKYGLSNTVPIAGTTDVVHLPMAELDWTGAPQVELGYRFQEGCGEVLVSYRSLVSEGTAVLPGFDLDGSDGWLKSRLNANVIDIDYASREYGLAPHWEMRWKVGARLASVFFDSDALAFFLQQRTSNDFRGAGPHLGLELNHTFNRRAWGFYTRIEAAAVIGEIRQSFGESVAFPDGTLIGGATLIHQTQTVPVVNYQVGFSWTPPYDGHWLRVLGGYEIENWWSLGQANGSDGELLDQGIFLRAEVSF